jgi:hypothetical protein
MPEFKVSGRMKVKTLRDQFRKAYGSELSVINPENDGWYVGDDVTLASCRPAGKRAKPGEINVRGNMLVGNFEKEMKEEFGVKIQIHYSKKSKSGKATQEVGGTRYQVPDNVTLTESGKL